MTDPTYQAIHLRLGRRRGPASNQACECGNPAEHWAYQHNGSPELVDDKGRTYSADLECYKAMCRSCHFKMDTEASARRAESLANAQRAAHSPESIAKMKAGLTGKKRSPEARENYRKAWSPERRALFGAQVRKAHAEGRYSR